MQVQRCRCRGVGADKVQRFRGVQGQCKCRGSGVGAGGVGASRVSLGVGAEVQRFMQVQRCRGAGVQQWCRGAGVQRSREGAECINICSNQQS